ncbi:MAG: GYD domain-containing protein [Thermodesulfobacteriota bacterium]
MALYIMLSKLTHEGRITIKERPGRIREVGKELEKIGVKILEQYATLGEYDFVNIVEAPDNETFGKVSVDLCSRGTIELTTLAAVEIDSLISSLNRVKAEKEKKMKELQKS